MSDRHSVSAFASGIWHPNPAFGIPRGASGIEHWAFGFGFGFGIRHPAIGNRHSAFGFGVRHSAFGIRHSAFGIRH
ncbi:conserved hypothetical protein [Burkholderia sp. 8Y]|nr:conserved hypothetical protein [Burkholderia sp. 8Y]